MQSKQKEIGLACRMMEVGVVVLIVAVVVALLVFFLGRDQFTRESRVEQKFQEIARDYYENYLYDNFVAEQKQEGKTELSEMFANYLVRGFPKVKLRTLLLYDNGKYSEWREFFVSDQYKCDTNTTAVTFKPVEPFGKTDYEMNTKMMCDEE